MLTYDISFEQDGADPYSYDVLVFPSALRNSYLALIIPNSHQVPRVFDTMGQKIIKGETAEGTYAQAIQWLKEVPEHADLPLHESKQRERI